MIFFFFPFWVSFFVGTSLAKPWQKYTVVYIKFGVACLPARTWNLFRLDHPQETDG